jgi:hypothetical protein
MKSFVVSSLIFPILLVASAAWGDDDPQNGWVLVEGDRSHMSGSMQDVADARAQRRGDETLLYLRRGESAWVIRDAATLARVRAAWGPAWQLGARMEGVGKKMQLIGARQASVGDKMLPIGERMGELGLELAARHDDEERREAIQAEMDRLQEKMDKLQKVMEALNLEMRPFSREMEKMGEEMGRLSARGERETLAAADRAIAAGQAQQVR